MKARTFESREELQSFCASPEFDQPEVGASRIRLLILSTQRSGSTLVSEWLRTAGVGVGFEYLNPLFLQEFHRRHEVRFSRLTEYLRMLEKRRTTPNGVFSCKIVLAQLPAVAAALGVPVENIAAELTAFATHTLFLHRRRKLRQASSLLLSQETGRAIHLMEGEREYEIGEETVGDLLDHLLSIAVSDLQLDSWSEQSRVPARRLIYEDFVEDPERHIREIIDWLGNVEHLPLEPPVLEPQRSKLNERIEEAFCSWLKGEAR